MAQNKTTRTPRTLITVAEILPNTAATEAAAKIHSNAGADNLASVYLKNLLEALDAEGTEVEKYGQASVIITLAKALIARQEEIRKGTRLTDIDWESGPQP